MERSNKILAMLPLPQEDPWDFLKAHGGVPKYIHMSPMEREHREKLLFPRGKRQLYSCHGMMP